MIKIKAQHTPGPWTHGPKEDFRGQCCIFEENNSGGRILAVVDVSDDQDNANARLIAAAPDLLTAANNLDQWLSTQFPTKLLGRKDNERRIVLLRNLRAAIVRAEGQEG